MFCTCIVLDEASSFLSEKLELEFYSKLQELGITFLSVGHRSSLNKVLLCCVVCFIIQHICSFTNIFSVLMEKEVGLTSSCVMFSDPQNFLLSIYALYHEYFCMYHTSLTE